jgi:hypothetical protein
MEFSKITNAEANYKRCKERLGEGQFRLSQQSGLWALELMAACKELMRPHSDRIEEARNAMGWRVSESTREELRKSYKRIQDLYFTLEERMENTAAVLAEKGYPLLKEAIGRVKNSTNSGQTNDILNDVFRKAGESRKESTPGANDTGGTGTGGSTGGGGGDSGFGAAPSGPVATQNGPICVLKPTSKRSQINIPGTVTNNGKTILSPEFGAIDVGSEVTLSNGTSLFQSDKGVVVVFPDGSKYLIGGAKLNPDGTITMSDGRVINGSDLAQSVPPGKLVINTPNGPVSVPTVVAMDPLGKPLLEQPRTQPSTPRDNPPNIYPTDNKPYTGGVGEKKLLDKNGNPLVRDPNFPPFEQGERKGVRCSYIGGFDKLLTKETMIVQTVTQASATELRVSETKGEERSWDMDITELGKKTATGSLEASFQLVDKNGRREFTVDKWYAVDGSGNRASAEALQGQPEGQKITFSKSGSYKVTVEGKTDWNSKFTVEVDYTVGID